MSWLLEGKLHPPVRGWAVGLLRAVQAAWRQWSRELQQAVEIRERQVLLRKLTEEERYAKHVANDHVPYLRGCPICISAQGRQRSHWRSSFPAIHSLSVDIAGPFLEGMSFDPEASGRDRGGKYRYFLACSYAVPKGYGELLMGKRACRVKGRLLPSLQGSRKIV